MHPIAISILIAACVFAGALFGLFFHSRLPAAHLTRETQDVVRLGIGMLSVLASLVLGLLISTAKTASDNTDREVRSYAADIILLGETLRDYGQSAAVPAALLRRFTEQTMHDIWPVAGSRATLERQSTGQTLEHVRETIRALRPIDNGQRWLRDQALQIVTTVLHERWQLIEHQGPSVRPIVMTVLVSWIAIIFASFGLNAPRNGTVVGVFLICSIAIGGAVFLVLAMDSPFQGVLRISPQPMANALAQIGPS